MILVTGSTGNVGNAVCEQIHGRGQAFFALARDPETAQAKLPDGVAIRQGEFGDSESLKEAMTGIERVFLVSPATADMLNHQCNVIDAAKECDVRHVVKLSGMGASTEAPARLPRLHAEIENHLIGSGLDYTIIRPNLFTQVLLMNADSVKSDRAVYAPAGDGRISFTDVRDIAHVIAETLLNPADHRNRAYDITGPAAHTFQEAAELLGDAVDADVKHVDVSPEQAKDSMLAAGMSEWTAEAMLELFAVYRAGHGEEVTNQVEAATGSQPRSLEEFVRAYRTAFA